jgi:ATP/maltotriose-dependent transcriptional regulator MalT/DNA-binding SARP family transcriptional activator
LIDTAPLLRAKLLPPGLGPHHLRRPRLLERLQGGLRGRATLIAAGPGYGKTSLVTEFLQEHGGDSVYYRLDALDGDPLVFFRYLIHGLREHVPEFAERSQGLWSEPPDRPVEPARLSDIFIRDAEESLGGEMLLVLDDVHNLEAGAPCTGALKRLLAYLPGTLHLILVGRSLPELGLRTLIMDGAVSVIERKDLLFSLEETGSLLTESFGLAIQPSAIRKVQERTGGWVTALRLLQQTARLGAGTDAGYGEIPEEIFRRTESEIFDYFSEEVFAAEPPEARRFLIESSPPPIIDPEICSEVMERADVRSILAGLVRRNILISPLESRGEYYAFDPLFRDFLARKLRVEAGSDGKRALDARYGRAFERRGDFASALDHFMEADDPAAVVDLLSRNGKLLLRAGMLEAVKRAASFASANGARSVELEDLLGEVCRLQGDYAAAVGHFERALSAESGSAAPSLAGNRRAATLQGLAYALLKTGDLKRAARTAGEALRGIGGEDHALHARVRNTLAIVHYRENRHAEAIAGWQSALVHAREADDAHLTLMIAHNLGLPHAVRGDFQRASECFRILTGPDNPRLGPEEGAAYLNLARIATLRGEHARAASLLGDAAEIARKWRLQALTADVVEAEGTLLRETGDYDAAREKYARARALFTELGLLEVVDNLGEEEALLACLRGEKEQAERMASGIVERRRGAAGESGLASALLALGEIKVRNGDPAGAVADLAEAASLSGRLERAYETCLAHLWTALARHQSGRRKEAESAAASALGLASMHDYRAAVLRVAALDEGFRRLLAHLPGAPAGLSESPALAPSPVLPAAGGPRRADLTVRLLGPIEVHRDADGKIPASAWTLRRALQIFCLVASSRGRRASKDRIVDALWGAARPSVIEKNFHPTISFLRRALNFGHNVPKNFVLYEGGAYLLNPVYTYELDIEEFESRLRAARAAALKGDGAEARAGFGAAIALYRGPFLEDEYDDWSEAPRTRYATLFVAALKDSGTLHLGAGDPDEAIVLFEKLVGCDPLDEEASGLLMKAFGRRGNRAGVEKEFHRLSVALKKEMAAAPMPPTRRIYEESRGRAAPSK